MSTTLPASRATSVPEASATPMSAAASAGASLIPSPTKATTVFTPAAASSAALVGDSRGTGSPGMPMSGSEAAMKAGSVTSISKMRSSSFSVSRASAAALPSMETSAAPRTARTQSAFSSGFTPANTWSGAMPTSSAMAQAVGAASPVTM